MNDVLFFHNSMEAVGCQISGCHSDGSVRWSGTPNEPLAALDFASIDKPLSSPECQALQAAITPEQWAAYQAVRKAPIQQARRTRYTEETDGMRFDADFDFKIGSPEWEAAIEKWREARRKIKEELPYPSEK